MPLTRRFFLNQASLAAFSLLCRRNGQGSEHAGTGESCVHRDSLSASDGPMPALIDLAKLTAFLDPLPIPPVAKPEGHRASPDDPKQQCPFYRVSIRQISAQVHSQVKPTTFWSYGTTFPGPTFETRSGQGIFVEWANDLPAKHFLPIDHRLCGAEEDKPEVRSVVHVHGAIVPPESDGFPESWFTPGKSAIYHYPNQQDAAMLWYHDHSMGVERLNIYAGLFGAFFIRDEHETSLNLPAGKYEVPLILCDRMFREDGQLYYPATRGSSGPWIPQFFGNCTLVNGKILPYLNVEPRKYRFRVVNAANARFFHLALDNGQPFQQIGADQGLLPEPVEVRRLSIAPGERADLVLNFAEAGAKAITLKNEALPVMQFRVATGRVSDPSSLPATLRPAAKIAESDSVMTRTLTLNEYNDLTGKTVRMLLDGKRWGDPVSEKPRQNTVEIWSFVNLTSDTHPIHLHQTRFQILDRRNIDVPEYLMSGNIRFRGAATAPGPNECGWKDTVRASGKSITRIIVRFDGYPGRYVWHCHILEHAANEMMRPYEILSGRSSNLKLSGEGATYSYGVSRNTGGDSV